MKNLSRVWLKKKEKAVRQGTDRRKHNSVSAVSDHTSTSSLPPLSLLTTSTSANSGFRSQESSPMHHIVNVQQPSLHRENDSSTTQMQEAWTSTKPNGTVGSLNSPTIPTIPKVSIVEDSHRDREDVISITKDVQKFVAKISELRQVIEETDAESQELSVNILGEDKESCEQEQETEEGLVEQLEDKVVSKLKELVQVVEMCLESNPGMQSTELTKTSKQLLQTYEGCDHNSGGIADCNKCNAVIESLVDTFTQCVSDYMNEENTEPAGGIISLSAMGGATNKANKNQMGLSQNKSYDNLARFSSSVDLTQANEPIVDTIDQALSMVENSVEVTARYIKFRQKYHREIVGYLTKRAQIEQRYYSQLAKTVRQTQAALTELHQQEENLPLIDVFLKSLEEDSRYAMNCNTTFNLQTGHKVLEPLEHKMQECEKMRKDLIHNWQRERKKIAKTQMKNAKAKYHFYGQEVLRTKNQLSAEPYGKQADKKKKELTDLEGKFQEAEVNYKKSIALCNDCQYQVHATAQKSILCAFRRILLGIDTTLKAGLENYYLLQYNFFKSLPNPLLESCEETKMYEAGCEFLAFIEKHPQVSDELEDYHFEEFDPEAESIWDTPEDGGTSGGGGTSLDTSPSTIQISQPIEVKTTYNRALSPLSWDTSAIKTGLQTTNILRLDTPSPKPDKRNTRPKSIAILDTNSLTESPQSSFYRRNSDKSKEHANIPGIIISPYSSLTQQQSLEETLYSKVAKTHNFKKLRTPSRCRGCDTYVYFHGFECETCGLACHRKCLSTLAIRCGKKRLPRKMNTFGVDFHEHLTATKRQIPIIVTKCINEIDERGLDTQGLYRISSAKSKMEKLCQLFEAGAERVDLSDLAPHLISSCLKLYFRHLPEPLLTFSLYHDFLTFAKEASPYLPCNFSKASNSVAAKANELLDRLREIICQLPEKNQLTLTRLMYHLHRVSSPDHVKTNCMPASNIGIVFGPNLLRQKETLSSLALLANMSYQAKAVEIMTAHAHDIFHIPEERIKELELESNEDDIAYTNERLVGEEIELSPEKSPNNITDEEKVNISGTTPYNTPPERRRQNVEELHEMLEDFGINPLTPYRLRGFSQPVPSTASPLLHDSRNWERRDSDEFSFIPGTTDDHSFTESVLNSVEKRLRPISAPAIEKILTPVIEKEDQHEGSDEEDTNVVIVSASSTLDRQTRRRAHSLTKSNSSNGFDDVEDDDKQNADNVFHSSTSSNVSESVRRLFLSSQSEGNIVQAVEKENNKETEAGKHGTSFESGILKFIVEDDGRTSTTESCESLDYKPFQSSDVQTLLFSASQPTYFPNSGSVPARSLPRNFYRPPMPLLPMRQMSEGQIKPIKSPNFMVGSPPLMSPVSVDKSTSIPSSSRGSFSEGFLEELTEDSIKHGGVKTESVSNKKVKELEQRDHVKYRDKSSKASSHSKVDSGTEDNRISSTSVDEDIPLPDESPIVVKSQNLRHKLTASRDSGLSDSPDSFVDICSSSPSHSINSRVLADKLTQLDTKDNTITSRQKPHPSPLINEQRTQYKTTPTRSSSASNVTTPRKSSRVTRHVMRVMKITPSFDMENNKPSSLFSPAGADNESTLHEERLRMISPEAVTSPVSDWNMKRSKSHAEGAFPQLTDEIEDDETLVGDLMISEAKTNRKISRVSMTTQGLPERSALSKSLDKL